MTTRVLPQYEWPRLVGTELETVWPVLNPAQADILVVEDAGVIVGCWAVIRYVHVEGLWIAPSARRKASVGRRLWLGLQKLAQHLGATSVLTGAMSDDVRALLDHVGATKLPGDHYVMPMRES